MANRFDLTGKLALITGSSQGIGLSLAKAMAEHGARIILNGRTAARLEEGARVLTALCADVTISAFDVVDQSAVQAAVATIEDTVGPIDILVNNAGIQHRAPLDEFPREQWDRIVATNLSSIFYVSQAVAQRMIPRGAGKIVNIASVQAELARSSIAPYTATKGAVRNLTRGMCADWARHGLQINAIAPGYFKTPLNQALVDDETFTKWLQQRTPAARWGNLEELAGAAVFLASDAASFVNGHTLFVDGGISVSL